MYTKIPFLLLITHFWFPLGSLCLHSFVFAALLRPMSFYEKLAERKRLKKLKQYQETNAIPQLMLDMSAAKDVIENDLEFRTRSQSHSNGKNPYLLASCEDNTVHSSLPTSLDKLTSSCPQNNNNTPGILGSVISLSAVPTIQGNAHILSKNNLHITSDAKNSKLPVENSDENDQVPAEKKKLYSCAIWFRPKVRHLSLVHL